MTRKLSPDVDPESAIQAFALRILDTRFTGETDRVKAREFLVKLRTSEAIETLRTVILKQTQGMARVAGAGGVEEGMYELMDSYISAHVEAGDPFFRNHRSLHAQRRLAFKLWKEIVVSDVWMDFFELFNQAYMMMILDTEGRQKGGEVYKWETALHKRMMRTVTASAGAVNNIIVEMANYRILPPHSEEESHLFNKLCVGITYEMLGILLRFDFDKVLKGHGNKDPGNN